ncbi:MAG: hypothetical protein GX620_00345 [Chloroflexi bacterium]|nr:hypothetical protein [Chloroflexota bacterium]
MDSLTRKKRVLILMTKAGGGHLASARALKSAFDTRYGERLDVDIVDLWMDHTPWPLNQLPKTYRFTVGNAPWIHELYYEVGKNRRVARSLMRAACGFARETLTHAIEQYDPDLMLSVHPLLQRIPLQVTRQMRRSIPLVTVITDLVSIHPTWFEPEAMLCFVPTDEARALALKAGIDPSRIRQYGLPIRPVFAEPSPPKTEVRRRLGLAVDLDTVLIVGGGDGVGPVRDTAQAIAHRFSTATEGGCPSGCQMVIVCGRNEKLRISLQGVSWPIPTEVLGFVDEIWDWMAASDCVVTKAGPGTIAESLTRGLPMVISGYIPGQEEGNVSYVQDHQVGVFETDPNRIADTVARWFGDDRAELILMSRRCHTLARPRATIEIVDETTRHLGETPPAPWEEPRVLWRSVLP